MSVMFCIGFFTGIVFTAIMATAIFYAVTSMFGINFSRKSDELDNVNAHRK